MSAGSGSGSAGLGLLASKIDKLLQVQKEKKQKTPAKKTFTAAKKQFREYRKKAIKKVKDENKAIRKREAAKIKKLPQKERPAARKILKEALKKREDRVTKSMPSRIETPGQMRSVMQAFKTLTV